ncbi:hypothetical protein EV132_101370 [Rhizobium sullae]|uniref:Uncharacterized protein n=1 Tax=Rhizobium sullae TaxID=50338 RepID=A0A4R3QPJ0_RHISU|nr:hypothetical protein EV132_101370 [Rhizobium sullae]
MRGSFRRRTTNSRLHTSISYPDRRRYSLPLSCTPWGSSRRGLRRRVLMHQPEFDCRQDGDENTDNHMHGHGCGRLKPGQPGRDESPQSDDEINPLPQTAYAASAAIENTTMTMPLAKAFSDCGPAAKAKIHGETNRIAPRIRLATSQSLAFVDWLLRGSVRRPPRAGLFRVWPVASGERPSASLLQGSCAAFADRRAGSTARREPQPYRMPRSRNVRASGPRR